MQSTESRAEQMASAVSGPRAVGVHCARERLRPASRHHGNHTRKTSSRRLCESHISSTGIRSGYDYGLLHLEMIVFDILGYFCRFFPFTFFSSSFDILWQNCSLEGKVFRGGKNLGLSTHFCYSDHNGKVDERALHPRLRKASEIPSMKVGIALSIRVLGK